MRFFARLLGWATLFALPCWLLMVPYQRALGTVVEWWLGVLGVAVVVDDVSVAAPLDLGLFAALTLSESGPGARPARTLGRGLPTLVGLEILAVSGSILIALPFVGSPAALSTIQRLISHGIEAIPWMSAVVVWLALSGARRSFSGEGPPVRWAR